MDTYAHIYLSPHLDDAVLSCGGRIWHQVQSGEPVLVVTIFAGSPPSSALLSPFAQELHAEWGLPVDAPARRREEDRVALALLGADAVHWPYTDCIYRRTPDGCFPYAGEEALWGDIHPAEEGLVAELATRMATLPLRRDGMLYAPLGAGRHVDHQVARCAVEVAGHTSVYYEDYPYAEDPQAVQDALGDMQWQSELTPLSEEALKAKIAAIACYSSQFSTLGWVDAAEMGAAVRAFAERTGEGKLAERCWMLDAGNLMLDC